MVLSSTNLQHPPLGKGRLAHGWRTRGNDVGEQVWIPGKLLIDRMRLACVLEKGEVGPFKFEHHGRVRSGRGEVIEQTAQGVVERAEGQRFGQVWFEGATQRALNQFW